MEMFTFDTFMVTNILSKIANFLFTLAKEKKNAKHYRNLFGEVEL